MRIWYKKIVFILFLINQIKSNDIIEEKGTCSESAESTLHQCNSETCSTESVDATSSHCSTESVGATSSHCSTEVGATSSQCTSTEISGSIKNTSSYCGAEKYLSTHFVHGFHVACVLLQGESLLVTVFRNGRNDSVTFTCNAQWEDLARELEERLELEVVGTNPSNKYPWAMFTPDGLTKLSDLEKTLESGLAFIFKGGNFIWPGIEIGHKQTVQNIESLGSIEMTTLSMEPLVFEMYNFLSNSECEHIKKKALPLLAPAPVSKMDHDKGKKDSTWRTSENTFLTSSEDPIMEAIDKRVEDITRIPKSYQEAVQVLRYELTQKYSAHHDFFDPQHYSTQKGILEMVDNGRRNRMITVFWYLSDVESGGETNFPRSGGFTGFVDFEDCSRGLKVIPKEGKVAIFYSLRPDGQFDDFSLHAACPVSAGTKWAANKWVWSNSF